MAEAEYYLPLPLGSPLNYFGGDASKTVTRGHDHGRPSTGRSRTTARAGRRPARSAATSAPRAPRASGVGPAPARTAPPASAGPPSAPGPRRSDDDPDGAVHADARQRPVQPRCRPRPARSAAGTPASSGPLPTYTAGNRHTARAPGTGSAPGPSRARSPPTRPRALPPTRPCIVTGQLLDGSWNLVLGLPLFLPAALVSAACRASGGPRSRPRSTPDPNPIPADRSPGFWAQVEGPGTVAAYGDAFSTLLHASP